MKNIFLALLSFVLVNATLHAQEKNDSNIKEAVANLQNDLDRMQYDIESIVIQENRINIPFSDVSRNLEIISSSEIKNINPASINELLQTVAGVDIRQRGANGVQADISIRGGTFEQTLVLINGIKMVDPQTGHHMMNLPVNVDDIERIEVLKGPGARVYGQNAFAGAVNIITKKKRTKSLSLSVEAGDYDLINANFSASLPYKRLSQTLSYGINTAEGYRYNTDYKINNVLYTGSIQGNSRDESLDILAGYTERAFGANSFYGNTSFTEQYEEVKTGIVSLKYQKSFGNLTVKPNVSMRYNEDNWQFNRENPEIFQNFHNSRVFSGNINSSYQNKLGILGLGIEYDKIDLNSTNLNDHARDQLGIHLEHRFLLLDDKLDITPGVYYLNIMDADTSGSALGSEFYPGLDIGYSFNNHFKLFFSSGYTSRIPTYTDLYYSDSGNVGNPNLQAESAFTVELGTKWRRNKTSLQASIFSRRTTDQIDWFKEDADDPWMPDNFNSATYTGLDLSFSYRLNKFLDYLQVNYLYLDASFEDTDFAFSRNALENLEHQLIIQPSFQLMDHLNLNLVYKYNSRVNLDDYSLLSANVSYDFKSFQFFVRGSNLLDTDYRETNLVWMPGRWVSAGIKMNFAKKTSKQKAKEALKDIYNGK